MSKNKKNNGESLYTQQEKQLSSQSAAFLQMLTKRGILEDHSITDENIRKADQQKKRNVYHNTLLMLKNYRDISWVLESFPEQIEAELDEPMQDLDSLMEYISAEINLGNPKLESRMKSIQKSRLLLERVNDALTVLRKKPGNGELMYNIIYQTYIAPEILGHNEILYRIGVSSRQYYRIRQQAINILSIRLWAAPTNELDSWLEVLTLLELL